MSRSCRETGEDLRNLHLNPANGQHKVQRLPNDTPNPETTPLHSPPLTVLPADVVTTTLRYSKKHTAVDVVWPSPLTYVHHTYAEGTKFVKIATQNHYFYYIFPEYFSLKLYENVKCFNKQHIIKVIFKKNLNVYILFMR